MEITSFLENITLFAPTCATQKNPTVFLFLCPKNIVPPPQRFLPPAQRFLPAATGRGLIPFARHIAIPGGSLGKFAPCEAMAGNVWGFPVFWKRFFRWKNNKQVKHLRTSRRTKHNWCLFWYVLMFVHRKFISTLRVLTLQVLGLKAACCKQCSCFLSKLFNIEFDSSLYVYTSI